MVDARNFSPSFERNIEPITDKLKSVLPETAGNLLEIGSGSGQHAAYLAQSFPHLKFQPTEYGVESLPSIDAWAKHFDLSNVLPAKQLDVTLKNWGFPNDHYTALTAFNVIHYAPWEVTEAIFENARQYLTDDALIIFYGPYKQNGAHTSASNAEFELWLKSKDQSFGVQAIEDISKVASKYGFKLDALHPMPANNFMPIFRQG